MAAEHVAQLFANTSLPTKEDCGPVLSLALSRKIVERHEGKICARRSLVPGRSGITFRITLQLETFLALYTSNPDCRLWFADGVKAPGFWEPYCWAGLVVRIGEAGNEGTADSSNLEQGEYARPKHACP
jgi:hypothetical protein